MALNDHNARVRTLTAEGLASISSLKGRRVLVLGDAILDEYLTGDCTRISPEAPVPVLRVRSSRFALGGAANSAANVVSLGGRARLIALAGTDSSGEAIRRLADDSGFDVRLIDAGSPTLRKVRIIGQQQQIVRLDYEDIATPDANAQARIIRAFNEAIDDCDIVVISDYAKGFVGSSLASEVIQRAHAKGREVIVDPRPENRECYRDCDYVTPNWRESRAMLGVPWLEPTEENTCDTARALARELRTNVLLTLGPHGIRYCSRDLSDELSLPTLAREVFDVSGAGDTVVAAFALAKAGGLANEIAIALANKAASIVVGKFGTATVTVDELRLNDDPMRRLLARADLGPLGARVRASGKVLVSVHGSFDVLHPGHLHTLNEARKCGDVLVVGMSSDVSLRSCNGQRWPIVPESKRAEMLLALRQVDYVHVFDEFNPVEFLKRLKPSVHVNAADNGHDCIERATVEAGGGRLHLVEPIPELSTIEVVERVTGVSSNASAG